MDKKVKCNKCGYVGEYEDFPKDRDFFQHTFISGCPEKCGNSQSLGDAAMRMFGGKRPFEFVTGKIETKDPLLNVLQDASSAS